MRILANYGHKTNGDSYSVTFETMGDVPKEATSEVVDELFSLAKQAIARQIGEKLDHEQRTTQDAQQTNGNGNGYHIKNPDDPATEKQVNLLRKIARDKNLDPINFEELTKGEAADLISSHI